jgi:hypothetical protein
MKLSASTGYRYPHKRRGPGSVPGDDAYLGGQKERQALILARKAAGSKAEDPPPSGESPPLDFRTGGNEQ